MKLKKSPKALVAASGPTSEISASDNCKFNIVRCMYKYLKLYRLSVIKVHKPAVVGASSRDRTAATAPYYNLLVTIDFIKPTLNNLN